MVEAGPQQSPIYAVARLLRAEDGAERAWSRAGIRNRPSPKRLNQYRRSLFSAKPSPSVLVDCLSDRYTAEHDGGERVPSL